MVMNEMLQGKSWWPKFVSQDSKAQVPTSFGFIAAISVQSARGKGRLVKIQCMSAPTSSKLQRSDPRRSPSDQSVKEYTALGPYGTPLREGIYPAGQSGFAYVHAFAVRITWMLERATIMR